MLMCFIETYLMANVLTISLPFKVYYLHITIYYITFTTIAKWINIIYLILIFLYMLFIVSYQDYL